jgi:hypothetical protein
MYPVLDLVAEVNPKSLIGISFAYNVSLLAPAYTFAALPEARSVMKNMRLLDGPANRAAVPAVGFLTENSNPRLLS